tara:strand:+ start:4917 stop:5321 length:405 start_codon:yes stop_codon:yes gene_type:complete
MLSYKKIDIIQLSLDDELNLCHKNQKIEIKSPILLFTVGDDNTFLSFDINKDSVQHNVFLNLVGYIDRLFGIKNIKTNLYNKDKIIVYIGRDYKLFDSFGKKISKEAIQHGGKAIYSYTVVDGINILNQLLLVN